MKIHYYTKDILDICDKNHLTADEVFFLLKKKYSDVWLSSVYRNLEELSEKGLLNKINWVGKKAYFEKNIWFHIHLVDKKTGKIVDYDCFDLSSLNVPKNFNIEFADIKVFWGFKDN